MNASSEDFVLLDNPRFGRAALAGSTLLLGLMLSAAAWWNIHVCEVVRPEDQLWLTLSIAIAIGGGIWWLMPVRTPRVILRANLESVQFASELPVKTDTKYSLAKWSEIREVKAIEYGEGYAILIESNLPDDELKLIAESYGSSYVGSIHSRKQFIPIAVLSIKGAERIAAAINIAGGRAAPINAEMSNPPFEEGRRKSAVPLN